jgi:phage baseplate assembly protein gpV
MDIIPSIYTVEAMGGRSQDGLLPDSNVKLRFGEVKREILPNSKESYSKLYREYEVLVQHYEGGSATHRMYHHCMVLNSLCGLGDHSDMALRTSDKPDFHLGNGSRVFLLCVEGNDARAIIIGGPQQRLDDSPKGLHKELEYNGVNLQINDDGSWTLVNKGKTNSDGSMSDKADSEGAGTTVKVESNGNFIVNTQNGKCIINVNHKSGAIDVQASDTITIKTTNVSVEADTIDLKSTSTNINSDSVGVGSNAVSPAVLGDKLAAILSEAFGVIGPTLPTSPQQAAVAAAVTQLVTALSSSVRVAQ